MVLQEKIYSYLLHLCDTPETPDLYEYIRYSTIRIEDDHRSNFAGANRLIIITDPEIYKKYYGYIRSFNGTISYKLGDFTGVLITDCVTRPDLNKFQILRNTIVPILTHWEQINRDQNTLLTQLKNATETVAFQNIGNTARTILQKLSTVVFDPSIHIPENRGIDLSEGKFKNRLHTYVQCEMGGHQNKELRQFAESIIDTAENAIDLSNNLTHDLKANSIVAEFCVISTLSTISIIKIIQNHE